jgi:hypothetical protein
MQALRPQEVRESAVKYAFNAPENYQSVYRKVLKQARSCYETYYQGGMATLIYTEVEGDIFHDIKSGTITVSFNTGYGQHTEKVIDISAIGETETKVEAYYQEGSDAPEFSVIITEWVINDSNECYQYINEDVFDDL